MRLKRFFQLTFLLLLGMALLTRDSQLPLNPGWQARFFTRAYEFNYVSWTVDALTRKLAQFSTNSSSYLREEVQKQFVLDYLDLVAAIRQVEGQINEIYANPDIQDPTAASLMLRGELDQLRERRALLAPLAESVLQGQVMTILSEMGFGIAGQPVPPVLYRTTPLPVALIISPRDVIRQEADISLVPELTVDQKVILEDQVDQNLNVSSLVVNIGGIGLYPSMIMETTDINWLAEVISHEWTHNYLTLRPLGASYMVSPELRTINETAASIAGKEIGRKVVARYYSEYLPPPADPSPANLPTQEQDEPPAFDYRDEMHETRLMADALLAEGKIEEAEQYMEERRRVFWENGYQHIRKLNQAYFAFYGAYADQPGGPAGADPVGEAVRQLWSQSPDLVSFLYQISWMTSFEQLQQAVNQARGMRESLAPDKISELLMGELIAERETTVEKSLMDLNSEFDGCADFSFYVYVHKFRGVIDIVPIIHQVAFGKGESFHCLIDSTGSNSLHLGALVFPNHTCYSASYSRGAGGA
jgi:hypothetical protein